MNIREKSLYNQIHPAKLATDIISAILSLYFLWQHELVVALIIMFVPPIITSSVIMAAVNLTRYKESAFGRYIGKYMTASAQLARLAGAVIMASGSIVSRRRAYFRRSYIILLSWMNGLLIGLLNRLRK